MESSSDNEDEESDAAACAQTGNYFETSQKLDIDNSCLSNSGQAIYKEVSLSLKFSNKITSDSGSQHQATRKMDSQVQEPKIIPSSASSAADAILERS